MKYTFDEGNARDNVPVSFLQPDPLFGEGYRLSPSEIRSVSKEEKERESKLKEQEKEDGSISKKV